MIVVNVTNVPPKLRGFLTKYLWEIETGVYVGNANARVREEIWKRITDNQLSGRAMMIFPSDNEQGFDFYTSGFQKRVIDFEGLKLLLTPHKESARNSEATDHPYPERYVVIDLETTSLDIAQARIIEIGAVEYINGCEGQQLQLFVRADVPSEITELTGITQEMAENGMAIADALKTLKGFVAGSIVVGYNIRQYDSKVIGRECARNSIPFPFKQIVDVLDLARRKCIGLSSYKLKDVAVTLGFTVEASHRAIPDCLVCNAIYQACV